MTKAERAKILFDYVQKRGFKPEIDKDGDVCFRSEGNFFVLILQEEDPEFYQLAFPNFWSIESDEDRFRAVKAAHDTTGSVKSAKISVVKNDTWGNVELFCSSPEEMTKMLDRSMNALLAAVRKFASMMRNDNRKKNN